MPTKPVSYSYGSLDEEDSPRFVSNMEIDDRTPTKEESIDNQNEESSQKRYERFQLMLIFIIVLLLGPLNFILYKVTYAAYGERQSFFVSNMVNVLYVVFGQLALWYAYWDGQIQDDKEITGLCTTMHGKIRNMALLDALAGFLASMGAASTSGSLQQLLNQSLIPITILCGWMFLDRRPAWKEMLGSVVILLGALVVLFPHLLTVLTHVDVPFTQDQRHDQGHDVGQYHIGRGLEQSMSHEKVDEDDDLPSTDTPARDVHRWAVLIGMILYASSNIPKAVACIYKELSFKDKDVKVHVIYLTQWVSIYQLGWCFMLMPLQSLPGFGSDEGLTLTQSLESLRSGWRCFNQETHECSVQNAGWLLMAYIAVNFMFNLMGLYLVKHGNSVLNAISYAIILPLTVLSFSLPVLGAFQERFTRGTLEGLLVVMVGFLLWRSGAMEEDEDEADEQEKEQAEWVPLVSAADAEADNMEGDTVSRRNVGLSLVRPQTTSPDRARDKEKNKEVQEGNKQDTRERRLSWSPSIKSRRRPKSHSIADIEHLFSPVHRTLEDDDRTSMTFEERTTLMSAVLLRQRRKERSVGKGMGAGSKSVMILTAHPLTNESVSKNSKSSGDCSGSFAPTTGNNLGADIPTSALEV